MSDAIEKTKGACDDKTKEPAAPAKPRITTGTGEVVRALSDKHFVVPETEDILDQALANRPFEDPLPPKIRRDAGTEELLNGIIAECHFLMRDVTLPSACRTIDVDTRQRFLGTAMELATTSANVAKVIARLRSAKPVDA